MPYWIFENGAVSGPMRAIEVLRRASGSTLISDGEQWFSLDDEAGEDDTPTPAGGTARPNRVVIRTQFG